MKIKSLAALLLMWMSGPLPVLADEFDPNATQPADQIIYPTAQVLPASHLQVQAGYVNLVGRDGWTPAFRIGLAGVGEIEWTQLGFYSDLQVARATIPTVGIKLRLPSPLPFLDLAVSLYNAQQWQYRPSDEVGIAFGADYAAVDLRSVDFESIYSRLDFMASLAVGRSLRLYPSVYYLESKSRNLEAVWGQPWDDYRYYDQPEVRKDPLVGYGLGFTLATDPDLTYLAHWVMQPQYHFDTEAEQLTLQPRHVWVAGLRYRLFNRLHLNVGAFNDEAAGSLSDVQVYAMLNFLLDPSLFRGAFRK
ncbi:MAG: hypothetical protein V3U35_05285 [Candidatus Neomarinimicrobiota bacterium]